jgi:hypothetical protein
MGAVNLGFAVAVEEYARHIESVVVISDPTKTIFCFFLDKNKFSPTPENTSQILTTNSSMQVSMPKPAIFIPTLHYNIVHVEN